MDRIDKTKALSAAPASAEADIDLINQYSVKTLSPEDVFCFSLILSDNEVDRDTERFTTSSLEKLVPLFLGKTVLFDHRWSAEKQIARLYRTFTEDTNEKTSMGETKRNLRASAYMLKTESMTPLIQAIEGGILKEVSVGCRMGACKCSICGEKLTLDWRTWKYQCENGHIKGEKYDGKLCVGDLTDPVEAYEVSFGAVPSNYRAGVTKSEEDLVEVVEMFKTADLSVVKTDDLKVIVKRIQMAFTADAERAERTKIISENQKIMEEIKK